ncbi:hypothetical protein L484_001534 [Morus notabilis]|uniref:Uncharacterized protein n=1 Tax=Morus notabilis TaxID=981085 RepID=W9SV17_9ROSA|nr:hypothetical protein L484_001534 [Morus notabilis]
MPASSSRVLQWLSLVGVIWLQSINGTNTNFPAYSSQLKHALSMSQLQLNNLAFASDAGKLFGWFSGLAVAYLPLWLVLIIGSTIGLVGYGFQYLSITNHIPTLSYWQVFCLTVLAGNSICWINTVSYVVSIRNFPQNRQAAVGVTSSYQGLSAKIYTDVVGALFSSTKTAKGYLLLNSVLPLAVCVITSPFVRDIDDIQRLKNNHMDAGFVVLFVITIVTGVYSVISSLGLLVSSSALNNVIGTGVLLLVPLAIPVMAKIRELGLLEKWNLNRERRVCDFTIDEESNVGLVFLNNLGQIAESRGSSRTSSLVSLSSSFGFFGRLMPSLLDYHFSRRKYVVSRPALIAVLVAPMAGSFLLLLNSTNLSLYISTAIIGVCTGAITSISVSTTQELFGDKNFSVNHNVLVVNIPIGSFVFGYFAALVYRREGNGDGKCMGTECYEKTFLLWGFICSLGTVLAIVLYVRTRKFSSSR